MDDDQQFCLRWNNHQSTLVSVFDNLLEKGTLVDCTLFAEGKFLKAHKVVLSACSPYFETLLTQQYDKHPIFILKDVKYQELKAMMDYMYRGEVNISQDQLAALLKAAESLQIKGLSDSRGGNKESETRKSAAPPVAKTPPPAPAPTLPRVQGLTIEQRKAPKLSDSMLEDSRSREGSTSPVPRKRKKARRRGSQDGVGVNDNHDASSSSESHSNQAPATVSAVNIPPLPIAPIALPSTSKLNVTDVPDPMEAKQEPKAKPQDNPQITKDQKPEIHSELILEPKAEYIEEEMNEDSVEDLTLDDDDVSQMEEMDHARPGPSHGAADGSQDPLGVSSPLLPLDAALPLETLLTPDLKSPNLTFDPIVQYNSPVTGADIEAMIFQLGKTVRRYPHNTVKTALHLVLNQGWSLAETSRKLEMNRTTLLYYLKKLKLRR